MLNVGLFAVLGLDGARVVVDREIRKLRNALVGGPRGGRHLEPTLPVTSSPFEARSRSCRGVRDHNCA